VGRLEGEGEEGIPHIHDSYMYEIIIGETVKQEYSILQ
jgi:hypothetical protein